MPYSGTDRNIFRAALLVALAPPLLVQCVWLWHNTQLPVADAVEQLRSAWKLYLLAHEGRLKFFDKLLGMRSEQWRPTLYYLAQLPFMLVSGGNPMFAAAGATLLGTCVTCLYCFRLLGLALPPLSAGLATMSLGLLAIVQWPGSYFGFSEAAFIPATLAALYHLLRSDYLRDRRHCAYFTVAAIAAFAVRPVESLIHFALLFAVYLAIATHKGVLSLRALYRIALGASICASLLAIAGLLRHAAIYADPGRGHLFTLFAAAAGGSAGVMLCLPLLFSIPPVSSQRNYAVRSFTALSAAIAFLYAPYMPKLVEWVYMCSFGSLAQQKGGAPFAALARNAVESIGIVPLAIIAALAVFSFCLNGRQCRALLRHPLLYALALMPPTVLMMAVSVQTTTRKGTVVFALALLLMLSAALSPGRFLRARMGIVLALALLQGACGLWLATGHAMTPRIAWVTGGAQAMPVMVTDFPNPNDALSVFLKATAVKRGYRRIALPIDAGEHTAIDPFLLGLLAEMKGNPALVHYAYIAAYDSHTAEDFLKGGDDAFLLMNDREGPFIHSSTEMQRLLALRDKASDPNDKLRFALGALYAEGRFGAADCMMLAAPPWEACVIPSRRAP